MAVNAVFLFNDLVLFLFIVGLVGDYCNYAKPPLKRLFAVDKLVINFTPHSIQFYFYLTFEIVVTVFKDGMLLLRPKVLG